MYSSFSFKFCLDIKYWKEKPTFNSSDVTWIWNRSATHTHTHSHSVCLHLVLFFFELTNSLSSNGVDIGAGWNMQHMVEYTLFIWWKVKWNIKATGSSRAVLVSALFVAVIHNLFPMFYFIRWAQMRWNLRKLVSFSRLQTPSEEAFWDFNISTSIFNYCTLVHFIPSFSKVIY